MDGDRNVAGLGHLGRIESILHGEIAPIVGAGPMARIGMYDRLLDGDMILHISHHTCTLCVGLPKYHHPHQEKNASTRYSHRQSFKILRQK